jgi:hypothetical protein
VIDLLYYWCKGQKKPYGFMVWTSFFLLMLSILALSVWAFSVDTQHCSNLDYQAFEVDLQTGTVGH